MELTAAESNQSEAFTKISSFRTSRPRQPGSTNLFRPFEKLPEYDQSQSARQSRSALRGPGQRGKGVGAQLSLRFSGQREPATRTGDRNKGNAGENAVNLIESQTESRLPAIVWLAATPSRSSNEARQRSERRERSDRSADRRDGPPARPSNPPEVERVHRSGSPTIRVSEPNIQARICIQRT